MSKNGMSDGSIKDIKELIDHTDLLLEAARFKLTDIRKAIENPAYLKSMLIAKEKDLNNKMTEILQGLNEIKRIQSKD